MTTLYPLKAVKAAVADAAIKSRFSPAKSSAFVSGGSALSAKFPTASTTLSNVSTAVSAASFNPPSLNDSATASIASSTGSCSLDGNSSAKPDAIDSAISPAAPRILPLFEAIPEANASIKSTAVSTISGACDAASTARFANSSPAVWIASFKPPLLKESVILLMLSVAVFAAFFRLSATLL